MCFFSLLFNLLLTLIIFIQCSVPDVSRLTDPNSRDYVSASLLSTLLNQYSYEVNPKEGTLSSVPANIVFRSLNENRDISKSKLEMTLNENAFTDFTYELLDPRSIKIIFQKQDWQGELKIKFLLRGVNLDLPSNAITLSYLIDSSEPSVTVLNQVGDYPKFIFDKYIDVDFSEKVLGAENANNFTFSGSAKGTLVIVRSVKISDTLFRLSLLGIPDASQSNLSLNIANIKDTNNHFIQSTFNFKIPVIREVGDLLVPRTFSQCLRINSSELLIIGGWQNGTPATSVEKVNLTDYSSSLIGNLNTPRVFFSASTAADGRILVAGGLRGSDTTTNRLNTAEWITVSPFLSSNATFTLPSVRYLHESVVTDDNKILIFGGQSAATTKLTATSIINPSLNSISVGPSLALGREGFGFTKYQSKLWIGGGEISNNLPTDSVESISLTSPYIVRAEGKLSVARSLLRLVSIDPGLLAIGGKNGIAVPERWNANSSKFEALSAADNGTHYAGSVAWGQTHLMDIGGYLNSPVESQSRSDIRLIGYDDKASIPIGSLKNARYGHCTIPLSANKILIVGGSQGNTSSANSRDTPAMEVIEYNE